MHRFRLLLLAAALVLVGFLGFARPVSAEGDVGDALHTVEEEAKANGGSEFDAHCIELLAEGKSVDDCQAAPNQLLPEINELIWGAIAFAIVAGFLAWKGVPAIKAGMQARTDRIQGELDAAAAEKAEAAGLKSDLDAQLRNARNEAASIIEEARKSADEVKAGLVAKAEADVAELRAKANADIEAAKTQAVADLRSEVTTLAIGAAEQVVGQSLNDASRVALVEAYIDQVGAGR